jgi:hypothetical protein
MIILFVAGDQKGIGATAHVAKKRRKAGKPERGWRRVTKSRLFVQQLLSEVCEQTSKIWTLIRENSAALFIRLDSR